ncbi:Endonuclease/Exonuclease/phosphatase family protein [Thermococcus sp. 2319x1]|uniref:DUF4350 domain-containing protein n=1 Tax=Thermococcus sp. 2319x1 TaxID=1674923 RepID=UPI00073AD4CB|nr:DUF4350 domain-containing protein [Thermococcus sp. 2319x1]ALV62185.1 Endonuclease/Exonuclease/phosphatase family protein [Thermococcus sp. 2319x1]
MQRRALFLIAILLLSLAPTIPLNFVSAAPYVPIHDIQYTTDPSGDSPYKGQTVITRGVVTAVQGSKGFFIQNGTGPWSGVYVYLRNYPMPNDLTIGSYVEVKGNVTEYHGLTELSIDKDKGNYVTVLGTAPVPEPVVLPTGNVSQEQWEGVLIKVEKVEVTNENLGYGEWEVNDGSGPVRIDDLIYKYTPQKGQKFEYIIGVVYYSFGNFKIEPRSADDIKEYIPSVKITTLTAPMVAYKGTSILIEMDIKNEGNFDENVTAVLSIGGTIVINKTLEIKAGETETVQYEWTPQNLGSYEIKAEIVGYDTKYLSIEVVEHPRIVINYLLKFYDFRYTRGLRPIFEKQYAQYSEILTELRGYGVDLGPIEDRINEINEKVKQIEEHYSKYLELKSIYWTEYPLTPVTHIRKAYFLTRETEEKIKEILPILNATLQEVRELIAQQANQTLPTENETTPGPSNITQPSNQTMNQTQITVKIVRVLIDSSHDQYYNDQKLSGLINRIKEELGWLVDVNHQEELNRELLSKYDVLIITNPREDITEEEAQAIKEWVKEGGGLLITGDWYRYVYYKSLNRVTEEFGIKFNPDELMDDDQNTGRPYFPLVGEFNFDHPATKFLNETSQLYYNGDTLEVSGNAVWVIRGYPTAYAIDGSEKVVKEKGSKPVVAAAVEVGKGRMVAYGSSKALSDDYYGRYIASNWPFLKGVLLWLAGEI